MSTIGGTDSGRRRSQRHCSLNRLLPLPMLWLTVVILEAELYFFGRVLGFVPADTLTLATIANEEYL